MGAFLKLVRRIVIRNYNFCASDWGGSSLPTCGWISENCLKAFDESTESFRDPRPPSGSAFRNSFCSISYETKHGHGPHVLADLKVGHPLEPLRAETPHHNTTLQTKFSLPTFFIENLYTNFKKKSDKMYGGLNCTMN